MKTNRGGVSRWCRDTECLSDLHCKLLRDKAVHTVTLHKRQAEIYVLFDYVLLRGAKMFTLSKFAHK